MGFGLRLGLGLGLGLGSVSGLGLGLGLELGLGMGTGFARKVRTGQSLAAHWSSWKASARPLSRRKPIWK